MLYSSREKERFTVALEHVEVFGTLTETIHHNKITLQCDNIGTIKRVSEFAHSCLLYQEIRETFVDKYNYSTDVLLILVRIRDKVNTFILSSNDEPSINELYEAIKNKLEYHLERIPS